MTFTIEHNAMEERYENIEAREIEGYVTALYYGWLQNEEIQNSAVERANFLQNVVITPTYDTTL